MASDEDGDISPEEAAERKKMGFTPNDFLHGQKCVYLCDFTPISSSSLSSQCLVQILCLMLLVYNYITHIINKALHTGVINLISWCDVCTQTIL